MEDTGLSPKTAKLMRRGAIAAVSVAGVLVIAKLAAWALTGSVALLASLMDSSLDMLASALNLFAINQALKPADRQHRFGHGKAEPLAGLGQAAFISGSAVFLVIEGVNRLFQPEPVSNGQWGLGVMALSLVLTIGLVQYQKYVIAQTNSVAIKADSLHYVGDILMNLGVIVALVLALVWDWTLADPIFALLVAGYLVKNAWAILRESLDLLMDKEFPDEDRRALYAIAREVEGVIAIHDLRTRSSGPARFIQLHAVMDKDLPLWKAHDIADAVEDAIKEAYPNTEVIVHQDPDGLEHPSALHTQV